jgi:hypothetical protein
MVTRDSKKSLVVPGISETIALDSPDNVFRKEDFPTFGRYH